MKRLMYIMLMLFFPLLNSSGQKERKMVREGVKDYLDNSYSEAEVQFRKALDEKPGLYEADYNIANSLYKQKKYGEAAAEYDRLIQETSDPQQKADLYHNLGNTQLMAQEYEKGIDAYKNSLRIRPDDEDTRYNLAYALQMLKQQQQQNQDKGQENKENDKQEKDQQKENQQKQNDQQDKNEDQKMEQQENQKQNISKQEAEQMLNAVENQEKEVKEKVDKKKAVARPISTEKDW